MQGLVEDSEESSRKSSVLGQECPGTPQQRRRANTRPTPDFGNQASRAAGASTGTEPR
jgi:hypothetical protein